MMAVVTGKTFCLICADSTDIPHGDGDVEALKLRLKSLCKHVQAEDDLPKDATMASFPLCGDHQLLLEELFKNAKRNEEIVEGFKVALRTKDNLRRHLVSEQGIVATGFTELTERLLKVVGDEDYKKFKQEQIAKALADQSGGFPAAGREAAAGPSSDRPKTRSNRRSDLETACKAKECGKPSKKVIEKKNGLDGKKEELVRKKKKIIKEKKKTIRKEKVPSESSSSSKLARKKSTQLSQKARGRSRRPTKRSQQISGGSRTLVSPVTSSTAAVPKKRGRPKKEEPCVGPSSQLHIARNLTKKARQRNSKPGIRSSIRSGATPGGTEARQGSSRQTPPTDQSTGDGGDDEGRRPPQPKRTITDPNYDENLLRVEGERRRH